MKTLTPIAAALLALAAFWILAAHAQQLLPPEMRGGLLAGYLEVEELPDSVALLPPPPALGSAAEALDQQTARDALAFQDTDRFKLAAMDADLTFPNAAGTFACAIGVEISEANTPTVYRLLRRVLTDAGQATSAAKNKYQHARPFMLDGKPTCQGPKEETALRSSGSYPSGHTSVGWAWAEILAELAPDRADAILQRGRAFGENRILCNAHWLSDVEEGRLVGAATVAKLHASAEFRADLEAARTELAAARAKGAPPQRDCGFELRALMATTWISP